MLFTKNSINKTDMSYMPMNITFTDEELIITDDHGNTDAVTFDNDGSHVDTNYSLRLNMH